MFGGVMGMTGLMVLGAAVVVGLLALAFIKPGVTRLDKNRKWFLLGQKPVKKTTLTSATDFATMEISKLLEVRNFGLSGLLEMAGVNLKPSEYVILVGAVALVALAGGLSIGQHLLGGFVALVVVIMGRVALGFLAGRRRKKFAAQLDGTLQMIASSLRAGHSLMPAIQSTGEDADSPTREEFSRVVNHTRMGRPMSEALSDIAVRMRSEDFKWVGEAISINNEVGGNLADVLDRVAKTIRDRNALHRQVDALAAEGKMSGVILFVLPFGVTGFLQMSNPKYLVPLYTTLIGWGAIAASLVMLTIGGLWMKSVVKIKF